MAFISAAIPMLGEAPPANAETLFRIGADGGLQSTETVPSSVAVVQKELLRNPKVSERLGAIKGLWEAGTIPAAVHEAQLVADFYWAQSHEAPVISADGTLEYISNGMQFVSTPAGCVKDLGGMAFSFLGREETGKTYSIKTAHGAVPIEYNYVSTGDVATQARPAMRSRQCLDLAASSAPAHFKLGVTIGGAHQIVGPILPLRDIARNYTFDVSDPARGNPHLDYKAIMSGADDTMCTVLPSAIGESQLKKMNILGGSGRPLATVTGEKIEAVGMQMNVTPITFKAGTAPTYVLCYSSIKQIRQTTAEGM